ncbi:hypothetical protein AURDEDRAFT_117143 [Auricularia subglabra TFB-10046 SS5]|nr:hypothetical protein AURDEDRAFT_117143 [Auricularia subglabra TFB-10046 SS5]
MVHALRVLFPLYIYPSGCEVSRDVCAWKPLYDALDAYPSLQFTVIVDPNNGPGAGDLPDAPYIAAVSTLNSYANVQTIGYVASHWGARPVNEYQSDVNKYVNWGTYSAANIAMHGVFVDEASNDPATLSYFTDFSNYVHSAFDNGLVVHNPGVTTPQAFFDAMPNDVFVTYENAASNMWVPFTIFTDPLYKDTPRKRQAAIMYGFTGTTDNLVNTTDTVGEIERMGYVFVTTQPDYNNFPTNWETVAAAINGTNRYMAEHPEWFPDA